MYLSFPIVLHWSPATLTAVQYICAGWKRLIKYSHFLSQDQRSLDEGFGSLLLWKPTQKAQYIWYTVATSSLSCLSFLWGAECPKGKAIIALTKTCQSIALKWGLKAQTASNSRACPMPSPGKLWCTPPRSVNKEISKSITMASFSQFFKPEDDCLKATQVFYIHFRCKERSNRHLTQRGNFSQREMSFNRRIIDQTHGHPVWSQQWRGKTVRLNLSAKGNKWAEICKLKVHVEKRISLSTMV